MEKYTKPCIRVCGAHASVNSETPIHLSTPINKLTKHKKIRKKNAMHKNANIERYLHETLLFGERHEVNKRYLHYSFHV